jgi:hypothetical protein
LDDDTQIVMSGEAWLPQVIVDVDDETALAAQHAFLQPVALRLNKKPSRRSRSSFGATPTQ